MELLGIVLAIFVFLLILGIAGMVFRIFFTSIKVLLQVGLRVLFVVFLVVFVLNLLGVI